MERLHVFVCVERLRDFSHSLTQVAWFIFFLEVAWFVLWRSCVIFVLRDYVIFCVKQLLNFLCKEVAWFLCEDVFFFCKKKVSGENHFFNETNCCFFWKKQCFGQFMFVKKNFLEKLFFGKKNWVNRLLHFLCEEAAWFLCEEIFSKKKCFLVKTV